MILTLVVFIQFIALFNLMILPHGVQFLPFLLERR